MTRPKPGNPQAASCDIVALCVSTDEDVMQIVTGGLLDGLRPGSVRSEVIRLRAGGATPDEAATAIEKDARAHWNTWDNPEWIGFTVRACYDTSRTDVALPAP